MHPIFFHQNTSEKVSCSPQIFSLILLFFLHRFMYEYSINYGQAPLTLLVSYTKSYLSMVGSCCTSPNPTVCFLKEVGVILSHR